MAVELLASLLSSFRRPFLQTPHGLLELAITKKPPDVLGLQFACAGLVMDFALWVDHDLIIKGSPTLIPYFAFIVSGYVAFHIVVLLSVCLLTVRLIAPQEYRWQHQACLRVFRYTIHADLLQRHSAGLVAQSAVETEMSADVAAFSQQMASTEELLLRRRTLFRFLAAAIGLLPIGMVAYLITLKW